MEIQDFPNQQKTESDGNVDNASLLELAWMVKMMTIIVLSGDCMANERSSTHTRFTPTLLSTAMALALAVPASAAVVNSDMTYSQDATIDAESNQTSNHWGAILVNQTKTGESFIVDAAGHTLTLRVPSKDNPDMYVGISALTASSEPSQGPTAVGLTVKGDVLLEIVREDQGSTFGIRNTGMSNITVEGALRGEVRSAQSYAMGISNQKYASVTAVTGDVDLEVASDAKTGNTLAYGLVAIGYPGGYDPNSGEVIDKQDAVIHLTGENVSLRATALASAGIQAAQSGVVKIGAKYSKVHASGNTVVGIDICNATGEVEYAEGDHIVSVERSTELGESMLGPLVGISNRGRLTVGENVDSFKLEVAGAGKAEGPAMNPIGSKYGTVGIITGRYEGTNPVDTIDYDSRTQLFARSVEVRVSDGGTPATTESMAGAVIEGGSLETAAATNFTLSVDSASSSTVHGLVSGKLGSVTLRGNADIGVTANNATDRAALIVQDGGSALLSGARNVLRGDVRVKASDGATTASSLVFENGETLIEGNFKADANTVVELDGAVLEFAEDSHAYFGGTLTATDARLRLNGLGEEGPSVTVASLTEQSTLTVAASPALNDSYADRPEALAQALKDEVSVSGTVSDQPAIVGEEGDLAGSWTAKLNAQGEIVDVTVRENSKLEAYGALASMSVLSWRHEANDLLKRMGELRDSPKGVGAWARVYGTEQVYGAQSLRMQSTSMQVGLDTTVGNGWIVGGALSYTRGDTTYNKGEADNDAYAAAIYGSWITPEGHFVDLIARFAHLSSDFSLNGFEADQDNNAFSVSAEYGFNLPLNKIAFVEPQAELTYGRVFGDAFKASNDVRIEQEDFDSLVARAGLRAGFYFPDHRGTFYARISGAYEFLGDVKYDAGKGSVSTRHVEELDGAWVEYALGANFNLNKVTYVYADLERTSGGSVDEHFRWNLGVRRVF